MYAALFNILLGPYLSFPISSWLGFGGQNGGLFGTPFSGRKLLTGTIH